MAKWLLGSWMVVMACAGFGAANAQTVEYIHTDALGTPLAVTDINRNVIERSEYEPYGAVLNRPITDGPGYTGHVMDAATGLTYMQQRYYDPTLGRFLSVDPVTADGNTGGNFNRYWYANNNPYGFTDPDGRAPNKAGTTDPSHVYFAFKRGSLSDVTNAHGGNSNRYFYTATFGWVDIRHFSRAAQLVQDGTPGEVVRVLGVGNEVKQ